MGLDMGYVAETVTETGLLPPTQIGDKGLASLSRACAALPRLRALYLRVGWHHVWPVVSAGRAALRAQRLRHKARAQGPGHSHGSQRGHPHPHPQHLGSRIEACPGLTS